MVRQRWACLETGVGLGKPGSGMTGVVSGEMGTLSGDLQVGVYVWRFGVLKGLEICLDHMDEPHQ